MCMHTEMSVCISDCRNKTNHLMLLHADVLSRAALLAAYWLISGFYLRLSHLTPTTRGVPLELPDSHLVWENENGWATVWWRSHDDWAQYINVTDRDSKSPQQSRERHCGRRQQPQDIKLQSNMIGWCKFIVNTAAGRTIWHTEDTPKTYHLAHLSATADKFWHKYMV